MKEQILALKQAVRGGVSPAMATPLLADGYTVNTAVIPQLVDFLTGAGVKGLFVGGTTGEGILLDVAQRQRLHEATVQAANGRLPIMLHIGTNRVDTAVALAQHAATLGVAAIAAVTPTYYGMHDDGLVAYYQAIASAAPDLPLLLYDIPQMAINGITPHSLQRLCQEVPTVAGIKTSRPNANEVRQLIDAAPDPFIVLAGSESIALASLAFGADGLISGLSTAVPEPFVSLTAAMGSLELKKAQLSQQRINALLTCLPAGKRIGAIKAILTARGIEMGTAVPPRPMPTEDVWSQVTAIMEMDSAQCA